MGFQSSFNQLLAAGSGAILGVRHIGEQQKAVAEQFEANKKNALGFAQENVMKSEKLQGDINEFNSDIRGAKAEQKELKGYLTKAEENVAEKQANLEASTGRARGAAARELYKADAAKNTLVEKYNEKTNYINTMAERVKFFEARLSIQNEFNREAQKGLDRYGIKLGGKENGK